MKKQPKPESIIHSFRAPKIEIEFLKKHNYDIAQYLRNAIAKLYHNAKKHNAWLWGF